MEEIREAVERAKAGEFVAADRRIYERPNRQRPLEPLPSRSPNIASHINDVELNTAHLQSERIVAYDYRDRNATPFDMLRTQVLQAMEVKDWTILGITSPTPGCGKTVTTVNLAFSIARQPERSVLLVDLDLRKPHVANCLGINPTDGVLSVLENQTTLANATIRARVGNNSLMVLPTEASSTGSSDRMASRAMSDLLQQIKRDYRSQIILLDLPPILLSDDVLAILPQLDCLLLVTAVGTTTTAEIEECSKHLQSTEILRIVLNKVPSSHSKPYYY